MNVSKQIVLTCVLAAMVLILGCENPAGAASGSDTLTLPGGVVKDNMGQDNTMYSGDHFIDYRGLGSEDQFDEGVKLRPFTVTAGVVPNITLTLADIESRLRSSNEREDGEIDYVFDDNSENSIAFSPQVNMIRIVQLTTGANNLARSNHPYNSTISGTIVIEWWYVDKPTSISGTFTSSLAGSGTPITISSTQQLQRGWNTIIITRGASAWTATTGSEPSGLSWYQ